MSDNFIGKFAVNEQKALGYIVDKHALGDQIVYTGIPINSKPIWISIKPIMVFDTKIDPSSLIDIIAQIIPFNPTSSKKSGSPEGSFPFVVFDPVEGINAEYIFKNTYMNLLDPFFQAKLGMKNKKMPESKDFKVDNDSDPDNNDLNI